ncbi:neuropeptide Y receptor type 4-2 [Tiliqua scincoides]|uniref:neuropeptide Y receptor type 4-2 n=1 Tax=Tiliqua scincoides TaxID=71010 RepID=UPI003463339D
MNRTITFHGIFPPHSNHTLQFCGNTTDITAFLVTSYSLETILGVLGNTCFLSILAKQKEKAIVTNVFITNLIASGLIMCIFCLPFTIVTVLLNYWVFGEAMCRMTSFIQCTSMTVSILSLVLIALERHQLIINPMGWRPSLYQAYLGIAIIWILASLLSLPFMTNSTLSDAGFKKFYLTGSYTSKAICISSWSSDESRLIYLTALMLLQYCLPLVFILVCYLRIYLRLRKRKCMFEKNSCRTVPLKRINVLLASMVVAFAVCWLPLHVFNSIDDWNYKIMPHCLHDLIFSLCHLIAMASACVNPIIYGFLNSNFRKDVKTLILSCQHQSSVQEYEHLSLSTMQTDVSKDSLRLSRQQNPI